MRCLVVALSLIASIGGASAQEFELPTLRGSDVFAPAAAPCCPQWGGFYVGGQVGAGFSSVDFSQSTQSPIANVLQQTALENVVQPSTWQVLGKTDVRGASWGGFVGYNSRWEGAILGLEVNYSRTNLSADAPIAPLSLQTAAGGNTYNVTLTGSASTHITDLMTLRARAGYEVGNFMPFAMIGVAAARADLATSATISGQQNPPPPAVPPTPCGPPQTPNCLPFSLSGGSSKDGAFIYGWSIGGGLEVMVMPNVFLRGEYEYVAFSPIWNIKASVQTARVALGYKF
jgi:outer membrane immunogenic protein